MLTVFRAQCSGCVQREVGSVRYLYYRLCLPSLASAGIALDAGVHWFHRAGCHGHQGICQLESCRTRSGRTRSGMARLGARGAERFRRPHRHGEFELRLHTSGGHCHPCLAERGHFLQAHGAETCGCSGRALRGEPHHAARCHCRRQCQDVGALASKAKHGGGLIASTGLCHRGIKPSSRLFNSILRCASCSPRACRLIFDFFALGKISSCSSLTWWRMYSLNTLMRAS